MGRRPQLAGTAAALTCALLAAAASVEARDAGDIGSWVGTIGFVHPFSPIVAKRRANARLVVSATQIKAGFEGYTGADHDPASARTTCSQDFRLVKRAGRWSFYRQIGQGHYAGSGYVEDAPCETLDHVSLKTTLVGGKLRADFGDLYDPASPPEWRAYLRHG